MTTMNTCSLHLVVVATAVVSVVCTFAPSPLPATADPDPYPCPWRTVAHTEDPFIQRLGSWAVVQLHIVMRFNKVDSAKWQGVGQCTTLFPRNYYYELIIDASLRGSPSDPGDADHYKYRAVVYVINFTQPQKLMSFEAIPPHRLGPPAQLMSMHAPT